MSSMSNLYFKVFFKILEKKTLATLGPKLLKIEICKHVKWNV